MLAEFYSSVLQAELLNIDFSCALRRCTSIFLQVRCPNKPATESIISVVHFRYGRTDSAMGDTNTRVDSNYTVPETNIK